MKRPLQGAAGNAITILSLDFDKDLKDLAWIDHA
jgi:hypothetical protein